MALCCCHPAHKLFFSCPVSVALSRPPRAPPAALCSTAGRQVCFRQVSHRGSSTPQGKGPPSPGLFAPGARAVLAPSAHADLVPWRSAHRASISPGSALSGARVTTSWMPSPLDKRGASHITKTCHGFSPLLLAWGSLMSWYSSGKNSQMDTFVRPRLHGAALHWDVH